ncbi:amidohydrolase family protein [Mesorhizobium sp. LHD-90]|uniref:amidohydrolase family protein n=1 Tax=Mesorhizobium sp. LHD-90 TaxID=3071414 RepID=UPI0027E0B2B5|nr:amidohydrolase family protein [Mesorhizobium sp. LHD-90]MDQ6432543.1 amidohydrolase family protein [Mesorhizobium sp. LHD-90]
MPGLRIVDAHHHLWDLNHIHYPWLSMRPVPPTICGNITPITDNFTIDRYIKGFGHHNVVKSAHVEAGCDPAKAVEETEWLQGIADAHGYPHAIVAKIEMHREDAQSHMERHKAFANVRGIRQMINWHSDMSKVYAPENYLEHDTWRKNFAMLSGYGLSFDLQIYAGQMRQAHDLLKANPGVPVAIDHSGMPIDRNLPQLKEWRDGLKLLAQLDHVTIKLSGLGMVDHKWTTESIRPYVLTMIDIFGPQRAMFGSNFPVDSLYSDFETLFDSYDTITHDFSADERDMLFAGTAERFYRI